MKKSSIKPVYVQGYKLYYDEVSFTTFSKRALGIHVNAKAHNARREMRCRGAEPMTVYLPTSPRFASSSGNQQCNLYNDHHY
ncbi:hypothetical protein X777_01787 [Ooceraea biroi]|uniref:Uncharacterized protein n=1 Tax=Ooceraea biroi TaxID=2015173 RepID=A0A026WNF5_OOCBI|nr:hypothetical protein X777_01787 [Ooceraea biroi]